MIVTFQHCEGAHVSNPMFLFTNSTDTPASLRFWYYKGPMGATTGCVVTKIMLAKERRATTDRTATAPLDNHGTGESGRSCGGQKAKEEERVWGYWEGWPMGWMVAR